MSNKSILKEVRHMNFFIFQSSSLLVLIIKYCGLRKSKCMGVIKTRKEINQVAFANICCQPYKKQNAILITLWFLINLGLHCITQCIEKFIWVPLFNGFRLSNCGDLKFVILLLKLSYLPYKNLFYYRKI